MLAADITLHGHVTAEGRAAMDAIIFEMEVAHAVQLAGQVAQAEAKMGAKFMSGPCSCFLGRTVQGGDHLHDDETVAEYDARTSLRPVTPANLGEAVSFDQALAYIDRANAGNDDEPRDLAPDDDRLLYRARVAALAQSLEVAMVCPLFYGQPCLREGLAPLEDTRRD